MLNEFSRQEILIGKERMQLIKNAKVAVIGIGGVGGYVVEGLIRAGIQNIVLVDSDKISLTNINRQIHANHATIGRSKVKVMEERILFINKNVKVKTYETFITKDNIKEVIDDDVDYIVDAIDTVKSKIELIKYAKYKNIKIISSMGTGNKLNPTMLKVADISKTKMCPLAKVIRKELKKQKIDKLKVVYSEEEPRKILFKEEEDVKAGSVSFVPSVAGLIIASEVIKDIIDFD